ERGGDVEHRVAVDLDVDPGEGVTELFERSSEQTELLTADAEAEELLVALARQPPPIGFPGALAARPVRPDDFRLAGPVGRHRIDQPSEIGAGAHVEISSRWRSGIV